MSVERSTSKATEGLQKPPFVFRMHWDHEPRAWSADLQVGAFGARLAAPSWSSASGSWVACTSYLARIGTMNRGGFVAQAFEPAGSGDFPVARSWSTGLESPVNPQAGKPALQAGSWRALIRLRARIGTMNRRRSPHPSFGHPLPQRG